MLLVLMCNSGLLSVLRSATPELQVCCCSASMLVPYGEFASCMNDALWCKYMIK
jgi:hypothetical protein